MLKKMKAYKKIDILISTEMHRTIKEYNGCFAQIFRDGYELFIKKIPEQIQSQIEFYKNKIIQLEATQQKFNAVMITKTAQMEELYVTYINIGRSITQPTQQDKYWIKSRTRNLVNVSADDFIKYCRGRCKDG